jgi:hypothetical protein
MSLSMGHSSLAAADVVAAVVGTSSPEVAFEVAGNSTCTPLAASDVMVAGVAGVCASSSAWVAVASEVEVAAWSMQALVLLHLRHSTRRTGSRQQVVTIVSRC